MIDYNIKELDSSQHPWTLYNKHNLQPKIKWSRMDYKGHRFYYTYKPEFVTGCGITTVLDKVLPESEFLRQWKDENPNWKKDLEMYAMYGTLNHIGMGELAINGKVDKGWFKVAKDSFNKEDQYKRDMLSIAKFMKDVNFEPILLESILGKEYKLSNGKIGYVTTAMDLVGYMDIEEKFDEEDGVYSRGDRKGEVKTKRSTRVHRILAAIDLKSSFEEKDAKSFFQTHKLQLLFGKRCLIEEFGFEEDVRCFNLCPKKWRSEPSYFLKEQKNEVNAFGFDDLAILDHAIELSLMQGGIIPSGYVQDIDEVSLDAKVGYLNYEQLVEKMNKI